MSNGRMTATQAYVIAMFVLSFTMLAGIIASGDLATKLFLYGVGNIAALLGLLYRENRVDREFEERVKRGQYTEESSAGFSGSLIKRLTQVFPIGAIVFWVLLKDAVTVSFAVVIDCVLVYVAWILTKDESRRWDALIRRERPLAGIY